MATKTYSLLRISNLHWFKSQYKIDTKSRGIATTPIDVFFLSPVNLGKTLDINQRKDNMLKSKRKCLSDFVGLQINQMNNENMYLLCIKLPLNIPLMKL